MQCRQICEGSAQCRGHAMLNGEFCYFHNPEVPEDEKQRCRATGGKNNAITAMQPLEPLEITTSKDVVVLLAQTINQVRGGTIEIRAANCLGVLSGHLIKAFEIADLERRLMKLEQLAYDKGALN